MVDVFGFESAWSIEPTILELGYTGTIEYEHAENIGPLIVKGVVFFIISVQLQILNSYEYKSFTLKWQHLRDDLTRKLGTGISYRFNNFKNKKVL